MEQLEQRITSMELCELINKLRVEEKGEEAKVLMYKELMKKIRKELEIIEKLGLNNERNISLVKYKDKKGELRPCYSLNASGMRQIQNSESTYVRVKTEEYIAKLEKENKNLKEKVQDSYLIEDPIKRAERWIEEQKEKQRIEEENPLLTYLLFEWGR